MTRVPLAIIHGRFQPLHLGHLEYLLAGAESCEDLVVGITNPDPTEVLPEPTDIRRGSPEANPFTFWERYLMVEGALQEAGVDMEHLRIVPFPHSRPERLAHYAPRDALYLLTIYDRWGEEKLHRFKGLGLATRVMWRRDSKLTTGSEVRRLIRAGGDWERLVPGAVARVIREQGADIRLANAARPVAGVG
jgi:cytidyltransferase-like protein